jgi:hypothetical protein
MAAAITITYALKIGSQYRVGFKAAFSGSYPTGGDTINFATATQDPLFVGMIPQVEALGAPVSFDIWSQGGNTTIGYVAQVGTTQANCKVRMMSALGTEVTAGTYASISSTIAADTVVGEATFNSL